MLTNNLKNVPVCSIIFYIVDVFGSFIDYKPKNMNNNKDAKGWDYKSNDLIQTILETILQCQILILNSMLVCNPIQNFESGGGCSSVVDRFVQQIDNRLHFFNGEEKHEIIKKFIKHQDVVNYLLHCARFGREVEDNNAILDAMKVVYVQITTIQHSQNLTFKNVLLFIIHVNANTNQMPIAKIIRAFPYSI